MPSSKRPSVSRSTVAASLASSAGWRKSLSEHAGAETQPRGDAPRRTRWPAAAPVCAPKWSGMTQGREAEVLGLSSKVLPGRARRSAADDPKAELMLLDSSATSAVRDRQVVAAQQRDGDLVRLVHRPRRWRVGGDVAGDGGQRPPRGQRMLALERGELPNAGLRASDSRGTRRPRAAGRAPGCASPGRVAAAPGSRRPRLRGRRHLLLTIQQLQQLAGAVARAVGAIAAARRAGAPRAR